MNKTYVQIGSGAGDLDPRADFRDGFTEYVKNLSPQKTNRIVLVEPNPINIPLLKKCWKDYPQAEIHQIGIRTLNHKDESLCFYFAVEDAPHYQVFSLNENHVRKHYPNGTILKEIIKTLTISDFFKNVGDLPPLNGTVEK
jgi:hypothetical protein